MCHIHHLSLVIPFSLLASLIVVCVLGRVQHGYGNTGGDQGHRYHG